MRTDGHNPCATRRAFTLVELLVVIAIIAILAGMIMGGMMTIKARGMVSKARLETGVIAAAIQDYTASYGMPPVSAKVWDCSRNNFIGSVKHPDFTYGFDSGTITIKSHGNPNYVADNAEIIAVLRNTAVTNKTLTGSTMRMNDLVAALNPKKVRFLDVPTANNKIHPGVGTDGVFRDPWGNPYIITVDLDMDGLAADGVYTALRKNAATTPNEIQGSVAVWSMGPDGKVDPTSTTPTATPTSGNNKDNVVSWDK